MREIALAAENLRQVYQVSQGLGSSKATLTAVNDVSINVRKGDVLGIVGESGCGKSTLARMLLGIEQPTEGEVFIGDQSVGSMDRLDRARKVQIIFQDPNSSLNPRKSISSIVSLPLRAQGGVSRTEQNQRARDMLTLVGLPERLHNNLPSELSGGQRQRVAIARALINNPEIIICDEPTSALDVSVQSQILNLLQDLREELNLTYVMISHDLAVVRHLTTHLAVMYLGEIVESGPAASIFDAPKHPYTKILLDSALTADPNLGLPDIPLGTNYPNPIDPPTGCHFHPRCPLVGSICSQTQPLPKQHANETMVRCHMVD